MRLRQFEHQDPDKNLARRDRWLLDADLARGRIRIGKLRSARISGLPGVPYTGGAGFKLSQTVGGLWVPASANEPGETDAGFGSWEARTNSIRNPTALGSVSGVLGSGGVLATNWNRTDGTTGLTFTVTAAQSMNGIPGIALRIAGVPGSTADVRISSDARGPASPGQVWTSAASVALIAGTLANAQPKMLVISRDAAVGGLLFASVNFNPTALLARASSSQTAPANTATIEQEIRVGVTSGQAVDLTLFIGAPQLSLGADINDPPILQTNNLAATRTADDWRWTNIPHLLRPPYTAVMWVNFPALDGVTRALFTITNALSTANRLFVNRTSGNIAQVALNAAGVVQSSLAMGAKLGALQSKIAVRVRPGSYRAVWDGVSSVETAISDPAPASMVLFGESTSLNAQPNGLIQRFRLLGDVDDGELLALGT